MTSVFLATPYSKPYNAQYWKSLIVSAYSDFQIEHKDVYGFGIEAARNFLVEVFKLSNHDYMLFADSDASWAEGAIKRLADHNLPMVCGCMYTRDSAIPSPTFGQFIGIHEGKHYYKYAETAKVVVEHCWSKGVREVERNDILLPQSKNDLYNIDGCGMHFTLIRRDVIEALEPPYFIMLGKTGAGEDFYFCRKVREAGFPIYADLSVHTGHVLNDDRDWGIKELLYIMSLFNPEDIQYNDVLPLSLMTE